MEAVRSSGQIGRANVSRAIGQCAAHHKLWVVLAERTVEVEEKKLQAMKNAEAAAEDAKTEGDLVSSDAVVDLEEDK